MALTTSTITGRLPLPDNTVAAGSYVEFTLSGADSDGTEVPLAAPVTADLDGTGNISIELWPNSLGEQRTRYRTVAYVPGPSNTWRAIELGMIVVPEADAIIADLLPIRLPINASSSYTLTQGETLDLALQMIDEYTGRPETLTGLTAASFIKRGSAAAITLTATVVGDIVQVTKSQSQTATIPVGEYYWQVSVTDGVKTVIWTGTMNIDGAPA